MSATHQAVARAIADARRAECHAWDGAECHNGGWCGCAPAAGADDGAAAVAVRVVLAEATQSIRAEAAAWHVDPDRAYPWSEREDEVVAALLAVLAALGDEGG